MSGPTLFFTLTDRFYGGEKCLLGMLAGLADVGADVDPLVVVPGEGALTSELRRQGIPWVVHPLLEPGRVAAIPYLAVAALRWLRRLRPRLVYVNANTYWRPLELPAARLLGIPVVTHHHLMPERLSPFHRYSDLVIANSEFVARGIGLSDVEVLDNPVDLARFDAAPPSRERYGLADGEIGVFFIGQVKPIKGVDLFLDAARDAGAAAPEARFVLLGDGPDPAYREHVAARVAATPRTSWLPFEPEVERAFASADVLVMPSSWDEPFGRIAIEAGAARKPIVCTAVGGIPEIVRDGENGLLVERGDAAGLAAAVLRLVRDPLLRDRLGAAGRRQAEQRFAAPVVGARLAGLLERLPRGRQAGRRAEARA